MAKPASMRVEVTGLKELQAALRQVETKLPRELRVAMNSIMDIVVTEAAPHVPVRSGRLLASLKARSTQREGRVQMGTAVRVPYAGWIEFGGTIAPRGTAITRPFMKSGRAIYPAFERKRAEIWLETDRVLTRLIQKAGLD